MNDRTNLTPAQRLSRAISGRELPPTGQPPIAFVPLDPDTLEHLPMSAAVNPPVVEVDERPDDRTIARVTAAYDRREELLATLDREATDEAVDAVVAAHDEIEIPVSVGDLTVIHRGRIPRQRGSYLAAILGMVGAAALILGLIPGLTPTADAATATKGPGLELKAEGRTVHVGAYIIGGHALYCTDWGYELGNGAVRQGTGPAKVDAETRARLDLIVNTWGATKDNRQAARVKLAMDTLIAPVDIRLRKALPGLLSQVTAADRAQVAGMVDASRTHAPYRVQVDLSGAVPGQAGTVEATVTGSDGRPAVGRQVSWALNGGTITVGSKSTDARGHARMEFLSTALGQSVDPAITSPSSSAVWQNAPSKGHQLMIGGGFTDTTTGTATAELCPVSLTVTSHCDCRKTGTRTVDFHFSADDVAGAYAVAVKVDGVAVGTSPLDRGGDVTITVQVPDGAHVEAVWSIPGTNVTETLDDWTQGTR